MIGKKISHYSVTEKLGAGGMGEVYRATDTKLNRDVALKVLPEEFARDADRMARFKREAQVLASLNHPNIAAIYGLEQEGDTQAIALELVEGPTLSERIQQGALPLEEALNIARQIAEALEAAHEKGIIHRDLKPANVKVTPEGTVKVLDFGLAKALEDDPSSIDISKSPTLSVAATLSVGDLEISIEEGSSSSALASPKSSTLTVPSGVTLTLAGLRSRWMMPFSCAASSASAICLAMGKASSSSSPRGAPPPLGAAPRLADSLVAAAAGAWLVRAAISSASVGPSTSSSTSARTPSDSSNP